MEVTSRRRDRERQDDAPSLPAGERRRQSAGPRPMPMGMCRSVGVVAVVVAVAVAAMSVLGLDVWRWGVEPWQPASCAASTAATCPSTHYGLCVPMLHIVGVPKAGTSFLWGVLQGHPNIASGRGYKEPRFFDRHEPEPVDWWKCVWRVAGKRRVDGCAGAPHSVGPRLADSCNRCTLYHDDFVSPFITRFPTGIDAFSALFYTERVRRALHRRGRRH